MNVLIVWLVGFTDLLIAVLATLPHVERVIFACAGLVLITMALLTNEIFKEIRNVRDEATFSLTDITK